MSVSGKELLDKIREEKGETTGLALLNDVRREKGEINQADTSPLPVISQGGQFGSLGGGQFPSVTEFLGPSETIKKAADAGVLFNEPAKRGHYLASFAGNDKNRVKAYRELLGTDIRIGPETGELEYFNKEKNRYALVNPLGFNVADIEGLGGAATVIVPEVLFGGATAIATKSPVWTELGAGAGAFTGEIFRLVAGQRMGINDDLTSDDIIRKAAVQGGLATAGGVVGNKILKFGKFMIDLASGRAVPKSVADQLQVDVAEADELVREVNRRIGTESFRMNLAQASGSDELLNVQEFFRRSPEFSAQFGEFTDSQMAALRTYWNTINQPYRSRLSRAETSQAVSDIGTARIRTNQARADALVEMKESQLDVMLRGLESRPYENLGPMLREVGDAEQVAFREWADEAVSALDRMLGNAKFIRNRESIEVANDLNRKAKDAILGFVASEKRRLIGKPGKKITPNSIFNPDATFSFEQMWDSISALKRMERQASTGLSTELPPAGDIRRLYMAMEADMKSAMSDSPARMEYERFVRRYAEEKDRLDKGFIGQLMGRESRLGRFKIEDTRVFDGFFGSQQASQDVFNLIKDKPDALDAVREGIIDHWERNVLDPVTGEVSIARHRRWLSRNGRSASVFMNAEELRMLDQPATVQKALQARRAKRESLLKEINASFDAQLSSLTPSRLRGLLLDPNDPEKAAKLMDMLRTVPGGAGVRATGAPEIVRAVQSEVRKDIAERIAGRFQNGERVFSAANLDTFLNGKGGEKGFRENVRAVFGDQYVKDLDTLNETLKKVQAEARFPNRSNTAFWTDTVKNLSRAYVGLFTRPGRIITALDRFRGRAANRVLARAITNPDDLRSLMENAGVDLRSQKAAALIGAMGGTALLDSFEPLPDEVEDE